MIDIKELKRNVNVIDLAEKLGVVVKKRGSNYSTAFCPFHENSNTPALTLYRDGWRCEAGCGTGDGISLVERVLSLDFRQAVDWLANRYGGGQLSPLPFAGQPTPRPEASPMLAPPPAEWQSTAEQVVAECVVNLGKYPAITRYLSAQRGLSLETIGSARLGYNPTGRRVDGHWLEAGITIPLYADENLWSVNVRTTKKSQDAGRPKYMAMGGSIKNSLYNADKLVGASAAVVCEGEFDTLLLSQYLPAGVHSVTMGSATNLPSNPAWLRYFAGLGRLYLALDNDTAGQAAVSKWLGLLPSAAHLPVPRGKDITEFWADGGDLSEWVSKYMSPSYDDYQRLIEEEYERGDMGKMGRLVGLAAHEAIRTERPFPTWVEGEGVVDGGADGWLGNLTRFRTS